MWNIGGKNWEHMKKPFSSLSAMCQEHPVFITGYRPMTIREGNPRLGG